MRSLGDLLARRKVICC